MECQRKNPLSEGMRSLRAFSYCCGIPPLLGSTGRTSPTPNTKENLCHHLRRGRVPRKQHLPENGVSWQSTSIATGWFSPMSLTALFDSDFLCTFNVVGIDRAENKSSTVPTLPGLSQGASREQGRKVLPSLPRSQSLLTETSAAFSPGNRAKSNWASPVFQKAQDMPICRLI